MTSLATGLRMAATLVAAGLAGCVAGPDYARPVAAVSAAYKEAPPAHGWKLAEPKDDRLPGAWWAVYRDPALDALVRQIDVSNQNLAAAEASFRNARAAVAAARASLFPNVSADSSATRSGRGSEALSSSGAGGGGARNTFDLGASGSWELDLWGKVRRNVEGTVASAQASAAALAQARLAAQATLATSYVELRMADELKRLLDETVAAYRESLTIARNQLAAGVVGQSDVVSAETQLKSAEAQAINVGVTRAQLEHAIAVLIGRPPADVSIRPTGRALPVPAVPVGLPSSLVERRPDVAEGERQMAAANAQIGVASAAYFPDLTLTGSAAVSGSLLPKLLRASNSVWSFGSELAETVLDGGLRSAQLSQARASYDETVANYRQTVLTALQQVEDALAELRILARQEQVQHEAVRLAREAVQLTLNQYKAGTVPYTSVITAQTTALSNAQTELSIRESRLKASVSLIEALGGGWDASSLPTRAELVAQADREATRAASGVELHALRP